MDDKSSQPNQNIEQLISPPATEASAPTGGNMLRKSKKLLFIGGILIVVMVLVVVVAPVFLKFIQKPTTGNIPPPSVSTTETGFSLTASSNEAALGSQLKVSVVVTSEADSANLFVARLKFPVEYLEVEKIDLKPNKSGGVVADWYVANWVENSFDNNSGSVSLVGGVPNPGVKTPAGEGGVPIAEVTFKTKKLGDAAITFDDTSSIYRDADNANILKVKKELPLKIVNQTGGSPSSVSNKKGDVNQDGVVDLADLSVLLSRFGLTNGEDKADLNQDTVVNSVDFSSMVKILIDEKVIDSTSSALGGSS